MRKWNGLPVFIMGASGTSKETNSIIEDINKLNPVNVYNVVSFVDIDTKENLNGTTVIDQETFICKLAKFPVVGVIIPFGLPNLKMKVYQQLTQYNNIVYPNIVHPSAVINTDVTMGVGNIIAAGVTISPNVIIENFCLVNNNCNIGHDTVLNDFVVINPLVAISGNVQIKQGTLVGGHAAILQGVSVGENVQIGLGSFVVKDIPDNVTVICEPAKEK